MFTKHFILILRNLWRFRLYSFLNLMGLAIALAVASLIFLYVKEETSYDRHFPKAERIYRIANYNTSGPRAMKWANGAPMMAEEITKFVPEFKKLTRTRPVEEAVLEYYKDSTDVISHFDAGGFFIDSSFLEIFDVEILHGNRTDPISKPGTIILCESLSRKFFGEDIPIGRNIYTMGQSWEITAICRDFPEQQHFHPTYFLPWENFIDMIIEVGLSDLYYSHGWSGVYTYALLDEKTDPAELEDKLLDFRVDFYSMFDMTREEIIERGMFVLQPIQDIHLKSHLEQEIEANSNSIYVLVATIAAIFILIIAGVNYVNLAIVKAFKRMREVGIRKVNGARRKHIVSQFLGESFFMAILSGLLAVFVMDLLLPLNNRITGMEIESLDILSLQSMGMLVIMVIILASGAGLYPAIFASRIKSLQAIRDIKIPGSATNRVRVALVVLQFTFSVFMILSTIIIYRQMDFFLNKDMGWDKESLIALHVNGELAEMAIKNPGTLKDEMKTLAFVKGATMISHLPGDRFSVEVLTPDVPRDDYFDSPSMRFLRIDEDFVPLMGIKITRGRNLRRPSGDKSEYILNEAAVKILELEDPIGVKAESYFGQNGEIVGVTENFHFASLQQVIEPLVLEINYDPDFRKLWSRNILLRLTPGDLSEKIKMLEDKMEELSESSIMGYTFIEDNLNKNYKSEKRLKELLWAFAILAIFISCLGLFGLSAFTAELKTKEMGIRKAMGASVASITFMLSKSFLVYVIAALLIALPLGYYFMNSWLQNFAYHISISWWEFVLASILTFTITTISVSYKAIHSGMSNPVDSLRYE
ncbi:MAG TPA: ABC transporter permease [Bacteroides sp.]|nr:ABC transporter permease [Bacteroides sp.]